MFRRIVGAAFVVLLTLPSAVWAQWPTLADVPPVAATGAKDVAIIVAVEDYLLLPDIPGAVANANEWEVFLRNGLKIPSVHVLFNQDATREEMLKFAKTAAADVGEGGTVWWVFIGHGAPSVDGKDGLLVGMDAQQSVDSLAARGLPQGELLQALQTERSNTVVIVDACFSGRSSDGEALAAGVQPVVAVDPLPFVKGNTVVLSAAKATQVAGQLDGAARPAFSYLMLGALRGWADAKDGQVTAAEALYYTQRKLRGVKGRQQTPQGAGAIGLVLTRGVTEKAPSVVAQGIEAVEEPVVEETAPVAPSNDVAALTLEYLQRRVVLEGKVARQAGRILDGPAFYHAIDRPDLADKWMNIKPVMLTTGITMIIGGAIVMGVGIGQGVSDKYSEHSDEYNGKAGLGTALLLGGALGGSFTWIGGIIATVFGAIGERHPMKFSERRLATEEFNKKLRDERGLGPEVDWQNEAARGPLGRMKINIGAGPSLGLSVSF